MKKPAVKDPLMCNGATLRKANRRVSQLYDSALEPCGLGVAQRAILVNVQRGGAPTMTELARVLVMDRSALAHSIRPLERDGYLEQIPNAADARSRRVRLTEAGLAKLEDSQVLWRKAQTAFERVYGAERAAALREALTDMLSDDFTLAFEAEMKS